MVNVSEQVLKWTQTDNRHASKNARNCLVQWLFSCQFRKRGDKYDTCAINKIRIWVDVFGERRREEMEINDHVYSTAHFLPKQLQNSRKSRSGKIFWDRITVWQQNSIMTSRVHVVKHLLSPELPEKSKQALQLPPWGGILVWPFGVNSPDGGRWSHVWHTLPRGSPSSTDLNCRCWMTVLFSLPQPDS